MKAVEAVQRGTMASIHELDSGLPEEQENLSLDARATKKRRSGKTLLEDLNTETISNKICFQ